MYLVVILYFFSKLCYCVSPYTSLFLCPLLYLHFIYHPSSSALPPLSLPPPFPSSASTPHPSLSSPYLHPLLPSSMSTSTPPLTPLTAPSSTSTFSATVLPPPTLSSLPLLLHLLYLLFPCHSSSPLLTPLTTLYLHHHPSLTPSST